MIRRVTVALLALACASGALAKDPAAFLYHGWTIHAPAEAREAITRQLDIVEARGMAQNILHYMRTVPIRAADSTRYDSAKGVDVRAADLDSHKPLVLHELLRSYRDHQLASYEADITRFYQHAKASGAWPADSPMLADVQTFFADTATVYLYDDVDYAPFTQGKLRAAEPEYYKWLGEVFDGFHGCE